jgi:hypothetical protein
LKDEIEMLDNAEKEGQLVPRNVEEGVRQLALLKGTKPGNVGTGDPSLRSEWRSMKGAFDQLK